MHVRLISLKDVAEDEACELRDLLRANEIDFYETPAGRWGISMPAIWLRDEHQLERATTLIKRYQQERFSRARSEYEKLKSEGKNRTIVDEIKENPVRFILYLIIAALIVYLSIKPFSEIGT